MPSDETSNGSTELNTTERWDQPLDKDLLFRTLHRLEVDPSWEQRPAAVAWLRDRALEIAQDDGLRNTSLNALCRLAQIDDQDRFEIIMTILVEGWAHKPLVIFDYALGVLNQEQEVDHCLARQAAADLLMEKADDLAQDKRTIKRALAALKHRVMAEHDDQVRRSAIEAMRELWEAAWKKRPEIVINQIEAALKFEDESVRKTAASWVKDRSAEIGRYEGMSCQVQDALLELVGLNQERDPDVSRNAKEALYNLWETGWGVRENKEVRQGFVIEQVLLALRQSNNLKIQKSAVEWLGDKAGEISRRVNDYRSSKQTADSLVAEKEKAIAALASYKDAQRDSLERSEFRQYLDRVDIALKSLWEALGQEQFPLQKAILQDPNEDQNRKISAIWQLSDKNTIGSREALRFLVDEWVRWIAEGKEAHLVELAAEAIRSNHYGVLALIRHFGSEARLQIYSDHRNGDKKTAEEDQPREPGEFEEQEVEETEQSSGLPNAIRFKMDHLRKHVNEWIQKGSGVEGLLEEAEIAEAEAFLEGTEGMRLNFRGNLEHLIINSRKAILATRLLWVDLWIAKQLADMSDPSFFENAEDEADDRRIKQAYKLILKELRKRAVPVMLRRVSEPEENLKSSSEIQKIKNEMREHIVRMLGFTGGREAVDALARRVVGKEKERKERQELLDEYYLKPSLKRGEEAAEILNGTVFESIRTLNILKRLNTLIFGIGLALLAIGLYISIFLGDSIATRVIGGVSALGGFAGIIVLLVEAPLQQIQNAMARLVHVETAFTSFIWQLNLSGTFIQSRYVKNGKLEDGEIQFTVDQIERAMETTMNLVSTHTEEEEPRLVTRLNRLEPAGGEAGQEVAVTIHGQNLLGDSTQKRKRDGIVAINHIPVNASAVRWTERQVTFRFPNEIVGGNEDDTAWISLFVDGMETNALPFHVIHKGE